MDDYPQSLPAALLRYNGRTLVEGLLRDLTAREWLYYKVHGGERHVTPVAVMTSAAKGNHRRIEQLIRDNYWFGRGETGFRRVLYTGSHTTALAW